VADMKLPDARDKMNLATVPRVIREEIHYHAPTLELRDPENAKKRIAMYYRSLAQMDDNLGKILRALRELDWDKDTVIPYTADHGEMLGAHGLWQKFVFYEPSVGVPLIVCVPGFTPENARCETPVSLVQVLPTLAELCGVFVPSELDGKSFVTNLRNPGRTRDAPIFAEHALGSKEAMYMIPHGDFKYSYYVDDMPELYNLRTDPEEMTNLALLSEYKN
jgi:choline-sulfatase